MTNEIKEFETPIGRIVVDGVTYFIYPDMLAAYIGSLRPNHGGTLQAHIEDLLQAHGVPAGTFHPLAELVISEVQKWIEPLLAPAPTKRAAKTPPP